jgi:hypothetical protein
MAFTYKNRRQRVRRREEASRQRRIREGKKKRCYEQYLVEKYVLMYFLGSGITVFSPREYSQGNLHKRRDI